MQPEISLRELLQGKATIISNKSYLSTADYVQPFVDQMSKYTSDFRIKAKLPAQMTITNNTDITYNRVLIEAVLPPQHCIEKHDEVIGFLYGLDVRKPISKLYRGYLNQACTNLCVFNNKWLEVAEIKPGELIRIDGKKMLELPNDFENRIKQLKSEFISREQIHNSLGSWVHNSLTDYHYNGVQAVKISPTVVVEAYKSLYLDEASSYFIPKTQEASMFEIYNAFTQIITDDKKDFMNSFEKTIMVNKLLGLK
jgi:hypothetical protein